MTNAVQAQTFNQGEMFDLLFDEARTHNAWSDQGVEDSLLHKLYDLAKMAPTSANCQPMRVKFLKTEAAKQRLKPLLMEGNQEKSMQAPVIALIAIDTKFDEHLPFLFPHADAKSWFVGKPEFAEETAWRNGTLQGGYLIMAARALGLDCGPMSGFDTDAVNAEFFPDGRFKVNFICLSGFT